MWLGTSTSTASSCREFEALDQEVQDEFLAHVDALKVFGPYMGRPRVDTLAGSRHENMKELRFDAHLAALKAQPKKHRSKRERKA